MVVFSKFRQFDDLPVELASRIVDIVEHRGRLVSEVDDFGMLPVIKNKDLHTLSVTSRLLRDLVQARFFKTITFTARGYGSRAASDIYLRTYTFTRFAVRENHRIAKYVKKLQLVGKSDNHNWMFEKPIVDLVEMLGQSGSLRGLAVTSMMIEQINGLKLCRFLLPKVTPRLTYLSLDNVALLGANVFDRFPDLEYLCWRGVFFAGNATYDSDSSASDDSFVVDDDRIGEPCGNSCSGIDEDQASGYASDGEDSVAESGPQTEECLAIGEETSDEDCGPIDWDCPARPSSSSLRPSISTGERKIVLRELDYSRVSAAVGDYIGPEGDGVVGYIDLSRLDKAGFTLGFKDDFEVLLSALNASRESISHLSLNVGVLSASQQGIHWIGRSIARVAEALEDMALDTLSLCVDSEKRHGRQKEVPNPGLIGMTTALRLFKHASVRAIHFTFTYRDRKGLEALVLDGDWTDFDADLVDLAEKNNGLDVRFTFEGDPYNDRWFSGPILAFMDSDLQRMLPRSFACEALTISPLSFVAMV
ncbi:hypothetical protein CC2G_004092 [Coprinopsis cinerea AmutBmut pab1-1]|nr:hypothetical protein CC2G_004092 [Coprinopsis cinerea AmutBmut pab1-1]